VLASDLATLTKAENWNDQFFTDLEAEVEAEGRYYATRVDRIFRRPSIGLRRVSSLVKAIERSIEPALLLVGEPGSGKSVALRHLAMQMAEQSRKSSALDAKVPLYLNLKELPFPSGIPSADFIREFVLDHIRRGDADTAAYVREHWDQYRDSGTWFFLFDSFDEIPGVLHAPTGSPVIRQYAEAIRQFLQGMSSCRGVLASREYKGPDSLPWIKFRILPLDSHRQAELVANSFLPKEKQLIVHEHILESNSTLQSNPLFLTLLCRFVKDEGRAPLNDHDLLLQHIIRLTSRDSDYIKRKYALSPDDLLEGATHLAVLFAENALSLAPTRDEIVQVLQEKQVVIPRIEGLLGALIDVKIGRVDVKEAQSGDQRFTFAHRRYQETLFVKHLAINQNYISPYDLLMDSRWREYTVTLLQSESFQSIEPILIEASKLIDNEITSGVKEPVLPSYKINTSYFTWSEIAINLLGILAEGLSHRNISIPEFLQDSIARHLTARWDQGDFSDKCNVLKYSSLLPISLQEKYITFSSKYGTRRMEENAYRNTRYLKSSSGMYSDWLSMKVNQSIINATSNSELLRVEALVRNIPDNGKIRGVYRRSLRFRQILKIGNLPFNIMASLITALTGQRFSRSRRRISFEANTLNITIMLTVIVFSGLIGARHSRYFYALITESFFSITLIIQLLFRIHYVPPYPSDIKRAASQLKSYSQIAAGLSAIIFFLFMIITINTPDRSIETNRTGASHSHQEKTSQNPVINIILAILATSPSIFITQELLSSLRYNRSLKKASRQPDDRAIAVHANSIYELFVWLRDDIQLVVPTETHVRSLSRLLALAIDDTDNQTIQHACVGTSDLDIISKIGMRGLPNQDLRVSCANRLEYHLQEIGLSSAKSDDAQASA